ncbi:hypothetical protein DUZ99_02125 [Xylanibacillus composti]|uniref:LexA repressor DNA-binding domain-containing protein n=1 Tax=Xylanibacillus composti TaxID=1572762 RepID=A0A8J4H0R7_9BACL|nr:MarR family transcriptional regulator [Xylanibacillus composti]MDT9723792.1 hypothetical protein [Xylanibacillus composti]GIQ67435.1 hypothetical protein XYCOK13_02590 [Xylanibacillus composti]
MKQLTHKQAAALASIESFIQRNSYSPTIRELAKELRYKSSSTVHALLDKLEEKGYISREEAGPRTIRVLKGTQPSSDELATMNETLIQQMQVIADTSTEESIAGAARQTLRDLGVYMESK